MVGPNGNKHKAIGNKNVSPPSKKKSVPGGKTFHQGKAAAINIIRGDAPQKDYRESGKSSSKPSARPEGITSPKCSHNVTLQVW